MAAAYPNDLSVLVKADRAFPIWFYYYSVMHLIIKHADYAIRYNYSVLIKKTVKKY